MRTPLLALAVGLVLADSAVVTLALPDILRAYGTSVGAVAWVLTAFNLTLGLAAVPVARLAAARAAPLACAVGLGVFASASAVCALSTSLGMLVAARVVQALGGAAVLATSLPLLSAATGSAARGGAVWAGAGVVGAGVGPVMGGLLTDLIAWESIFVVQVPLALLALGACLGLRAPAAARPADGPTRRALSADLALGLLSAALTAALFLLVLLLVEAWRRSPAEAAVTVTMLPLASLLATPLARALRTGPATDGTAGAVLIAGGLAALALLPDASVAWTLAPQALIGLGLGLALTGLTGAALSGGGARELRAARTIAARHIGVVIGLLVLTPVFAHALERERDAAEHAGVALLLDARIDPSDKIDLAERIAARLDAENGRIPDLEPVFARIPFAAEDRAEATALRDALTDQAERAATHAFQRPFLVAACFALLAMLPALFVRGRPRGAP